MRENCTYGSEGGAASAVPTPIRTPKVWYAMGIHRFRTGLRRTGDGVGHGKQHRQQKKNRVESSHGRSRVGAPVVAGTQSRIVLRRRRGLSLVVHRLTDPADSVSVATGRRAGTTGTERHPFGVVRAWRCCKLRPLGTTAPSACCRVTA